MAKEKTERLTPGDIEVQAGLYCAKLVNNQGELYVTDQELAEDIQKELGCCFGDAERIVNTIRDELEKNILTKKDCYIFN